MLAAAEATGVSHFVAQGFGAFNGSREGGSVKTEEDPTDPGPASAREGAEALRHLEDAVVKAGGAVLRYGSLYGPGAIDDQVGLVRKRQFPLVGGGTGYSRGCISTTRRALPCWPWSKRRPACSTSSTTSQPRSATGCLTGRVRGREAAAADTQWLARLLAGEMAVIMMTEGRGFSSAKAKRELGWSLRYPSWRQGFKEELA